MAAIALPPPQDPHLYHQLQQGVLDRQDHVVIDVGADQNEAGHAGVEGAAGAAAAAPAAEPINGHHQGGRVSKVAYVIRRIAYVVLALFALREDPKLFLGFFVIGTIASFVDKKLGITKCIHIVIDHCAGYLNRISESEFPAFIAIAVSFCVDLEHIRHHTWVFVPLSGFGIAIYLGRFAREQLPPLVGRARQMLFA